jgi:hypothetical protein
MRALRAGSAAAGRLRHRPPHLAPSLHICRRGLPSLTVSRVLHRFATTPSVATVTRVRLVSQRSRYAPQRPELRRYSVAALGPPRDVQGSHPARRGACGLGAFQEQDAGDDRRHGCDCCLSRSRPRPVSERIRGSLRRSQLSPPPRPHRFTPRVRAFVCARSRARVRARVHARTAPMRGDRLPVIAATYTNPLTACVQERPGC